MRDALVTLIDFIGLIFPVVAIALSFTIMAAVF